MQSFFENILIGIRQWVNNKLERITFVISSHINDINKRIIKNENEIDDVSYVVATTLNEIESEIGTVSDVVATTLNEVVYESDTIGDVVATTLNEVVNEIDNISFTVASHICEIRENLITGVQMGGIDLVPNEDRKINIQIDSTTGLSIDENGRLTIDIDTLKTLLDNYNSR